jgi:hypothetical protein
VTSQRKLKKQAEALGMTATEFQLVEMIEEVLDSMRWMQILAYTNQYLLNQKLKVTKEERDRILEAATRAVDKDQKIHEWQDRIDQLKGEITNIKRRSIGRAATSPRASPLQRPLPMLRIPVGTRARMRPWTRKGTYPRIRPQPPPRIRRWSPHPGTSHPLCRRVMRSCPRMQGDPSLAGGLPKSSRG